ncbi:MAG: IS630 transposase-related protein [Opitutaceae bacterium]
MSEDLRRRIIEAKEAGEGTGEVSQRFRVSRKSVARLWKQYSVSGHLRPKQIGGYRKSRLVKHGKTLDRWITKKSDLSLAELKQRCLAQLGIRIGTTALWHQLRRMGLSYKKNDARRRAGPARRRGGPGAVAPASA